MADEKIPVTALPAKNGNGPPPAALTTPPMPALSPLGVTPNLLGKEYVAGGNYAWYTALARALSTTIDDITGDFGDDLYERMMNDAHVSAAVTVFKASVLETGLELTPAVLPKDDKRREKAQEICDAACKMFAQMATPLNNTLWDMASAFEQGNRIAEIIWVAKTINGKDILCIDKLKPKPRRNMAFVVDAYTNVIGLLGLIPGQFQPVTSMVVVDPKDTANILPREKFAVLTFRQKNNDPRGTSILRAAYFMWWLKQQVLPEYLKYLTQFAGPSLVGYVAENVQPKFVTDSLGNSSGEVITPEQELLTSLIAFRNGSAIALPFGAKVEPIVMKENEAFVNALKFFDTQITRAVLTQTLATEEGTTGGKAAAKTHQDAMDTIVRLAKTDVLEMLSRDLLRPFVLYNYGADSLDLMPVGQLGQTEEHDRPSMLAAVAQAVASGFIHPSQYPGIDIQLGLPTRDPESIDKAVERLNAPPAIGQGPQPGQAPGKPGVPVPSKREPGVPASPPDKPIPPKADHTEAAITALSGMVGKLIEANKPTPPPAPAPARTVRKIVERDEQGYIKSLVEVEE